MLLALLGGRLGPVIETSPDSHETLGLSVRGCLDWESLLVNGVLRSDLMSHRIRNDIDFKSRARSDGEGRVTRIRDASLLGFRRKRLTEVLPVKIRLRGKLPVPWESSLVGP